MAAPNRNLTVDAATLLRGRRRGKAAAAIRPRIVASDGGSGESPHEAG